MNFITFAGDEAVAVGHIGSLYHARGGGHRGAAAPRHLHPPGQKDSSPLTPSPCQGAKRADAHLFNLCNLWTVRESARTPDSTHEESPCRREISQFYTNQANK